MRDTGLFIDVSYLSGINGMHEIVNNGIFVKIVTLGNM